jgi:glyoxylase-like metal-dependent hydrolase (beta-lactamase superfamily II)
MGQLNEQASVRRFQMDDVTFTFVADGAMSMVPQMFLKAIPTAYWDAHPDELDRRGCVAMSAGGLLVERGNHRLLIDDGLGPRTESTPHGQINSGAFSDVLMRLGLYGADIDVFALTHLHVDHTGWAFVESASGRREPTFPKAPYVIAQSEWEPLQRGERPLGVPGEAEFFEPIAEHTHLVRLIRDGDEVAPGVTAVVTPGHTAGHTSYVVTTSRGTDSWRSATASILPRNYATRTGRQLLTSIRPPWATRVGASSPNWALPTPLDLRFISEISPSEGLSSMAPRQLRGNRCPRRSCLHHRELSS